MMFKSKWSYVIVWVVAKQHKDVLPRHCVNITVQWRANQCTVVFVARCNLAHSIK